MTQPDPVATAMRRCPYAEWEATSWGVDAGGATSVVSAIRRR